jgi:hypothetical protein
MADSVVTAADLLWGPIALLINLLQHGFVPDSSQGVAELVASGVGTVLWATVGSVIGEIIRG